MSFGSVENQYLVGSSSPSGHSISSHSSGRQLLRLSSPWAARTRTRANREESASAAPSRQLTVRQALAGRARRELLDRDRLMLGSAAHRLLWSLAARRTL